MHNCFTVAGKEYTPEDPLLIAELGTGHASDPVKAAELIDAAAESGAGCIKVQIVYADEILHPNTGIVALPGGNIRLYDQFKRLEVDPDFFVAMKERTESKGMLFLATPFGLKSARELYALNPCAVKIASPELNYTALLKEIASYKKPVFLSSGVSKLGDIESALELLEPVPVCLFHCVTAYPAPETEYNLRILHNLSGIFGIPTGVSDHSADPCRVPCLAVKMGAVAVEKHFCLSRQDPGLDDKIALPPDEFAQMVRTIHDNNRTDLDPAILGDGVKGLAPSEKANYTRTNRSIHAVRDLNPGEIITPEAIAILRTEKILRPGLPPAWESAVIGRTVRSFIPAGEGIRFEDI